MVEEGVEGVVGGGVKGTTNGGVIIPAWQAVLMGVGQAWTEYVAAVKAATGGSKYPGNKPPAPLTKTTSKSQNREILELEISPWSLGMLQKSDLRWGLRLGLRWGLRVAYISRIWLISQNCLFCVN